MSGFQAFVTNVEDIFNQVKDKALSIFNSLPGWLQNLIHVAASDEGKILSGLVDVAVKDIEAGGLTSASAIAAAKDVYAQLLEQNVTKFNLQYVFSALNGALATSTVATPVPAPDTPVATGG